MNESGKYVDKSISQLQFTFNMGTQPHTEI